MPQESSRPDNVPPKNLGRYFDIGHTLRWAVLVGIALLPVLLVGVAAIYFASKSVQALAEDSNATAAAISAELVSRELDQSIGLGKAVASLPGMSEAVATHDAEGVRSRLKAVVESYPNVDRIFVTDLAGVLWSDYPPAPESLGRKFSDRDWYRGVTNGWKPYVSEVYQRYAAPKPLVVAIAVPLRDKDESLLGVVVLQHRLDSLTEWLRRIPIGHGGYVFLMDHTGTVAAHPYLDLKARFYDEYFDLPLLREGLDGRRISGSYRDPFSGVPMTVAVVPVDASREHWVVAACQPEADVDEPVRLLLLQIGSAAGLLAIMAVVVVMILGRITQRNVRLSRQLTTQNEELKRLSADLEAQATELEVTNRELEAFSYSVSHDLRAPLRSMDGFSQALLDDYGDGLDAQAKDYLNRIRTASQRMSKLIDDLLNLSRVSRGTMKREPVDLSAMVEALAGQLKAEQPERTVDFLIQSGIVVEGDPQLLSLAMENLLRNSWKFTGRTSLPVIQFGTMKREGRMVYFIRDNGAGFDMVNAAKLFTPFQRLHSTAEFPGTGIGLAIVQRIIRRHGGMVCAEGEPGKGAVFYFTL